MRDIPLPLPVGQTGYRRYQWPFLQAMRAGCTRAALVWHRRAGKDLTALNWTVEAMLRAPRAGTYYHFFPTFNLGRKILWDGIDGNGVPFLDRFPKGVVVDRNETELQIQVRRPDDTVSIWQIVGADKIENVGTNPIGVVFSEYAIMTPRAWNLIRPILSENQGWAVFCYTPRGKNHGFKLWQAAMAAPNEWFASLQTIDDTVRDAPGESGAPVVTREAVDKEIRDGMPEELAAQEYMCSWTGALAGAYYADQMQRMRDEGRIKVVRWDPIIPVDTAWDLGIDDETAIGFTQTIDGRLRWINFLHGQGKGLEHWARELRRLPYVYGRHYGPHDLKVTEWGTGNTRVESASSLGLYFDVVPKLKVEDGIQAVRRMLPMSEIDEESCEHLINALSSYHREFDEEEQTYSNKPVHDWSSHPADMARYRAIPWRGSESRNIRDEYADDTFSIFSNPRRRQDSYEDFDVYRQ